MAKNTAMVGSQFFLSRGRRFLSYLICRSYKKGLSAFGFRQKNDDGIFSGSPGYAFDLPSGTNQLSPQAVGGLDFFGERMVLLKEGSFLSSGQKSNLPESRRQLLPIPNQRIKEQRTLVSKNVPGNSR